MAIPRLAVNHKNLLENSWNNFQIYVLSSTGICTSARFMINLFCGHQVQGPK